MILGIKCFLNQIPMLTYNVESKTSYPWRILSTTFKDIEERMSLNLLKVHSRGEIIAE